MSNEPIYQCTGCGKMPGRDLLTVKRVSFLEMGKGARTLRSRVVGWLCPACVASDSEYNLPEFNTPGTRRAPIENGQNIA